MNAKKALAVLTLALAGLITAAAVPAAHASHTAAISVGDFEGGGGSSGGGGASGGW